MTEERPPLQWWPTESDLTAIRSVPYNEALVLAKRWPSTAVLGDANFGGPVGTGLVSNAANDSGAATFTTPPGQAP